MEEKQSFLIYVDFAYLLHKQEAIALAFSVLFDSFKALFLTT